MKACGRQVGLSILLFASFSTACAPLPKDATSKMADEIGKLSTSYGTVSNAASLSDPTEEWTEQMLRSGVALDPTLGRCATPIGGVKDDIDDALDEVTPSQPLPKASDTPSVSIDWPAFADSLGKAVGSCELRPLTRSRPLAWTPTGNTVEPLGMPTDTPFKPYVQVVDLIVQSLGNYYRALAKTADDKDLAAEEAKLKEVNAAVGALTGTAASFATGPAGPVLGTLTTAVLNLAVELRGAYLRYQRYNAIEKALVDVDDATLELLEDLIGTTVVLLQAHNAESVVRGPINNGISDYNVTPPQDRLASRGQLVRAVERFGTVRDALDPSLVKRLGSIGEAHKALREAVVARDGAFENTFDHLFKLSEDVNSIRESLEKLEAAQAQGAS